MHDEPYCPECRVPADWHSWLKSWYCKCCEKAFGPVGQRS